MITKIKIYSKMRTTKINNDVYFNKKLFVVLSLTGIGHLITIFFLNKINNNLTVDTISNIALIDSVWSIILNFTAIGIGQHFSRLISKEKNPRKLVASALIMRLCLSVPIFILGIFLVVNERYLVGALLIFSPVACLGAEFALYASGRSVSAAFSSFIRVSLPYLILLLLISIINEKSVPFILIFLLVLFGSFASVFSITLNKVKLSDFNLKSNIRHLKASFYLGLATLIITNGVNLIIPVLTYFRWPDVSELFSYIKLYIIFIGVRRVFVQYYYKELSINISNVRYLSFRFRSLVLIALVVLLVLVAIDIDVLSLLIGIEINYMFEFFICIFSSSIYFGYLTRLLIDKQDHYYSLVSVIFILILLVGVCFGILFNWSVGGYLLVIASAELVVGLIAFVVTRNHSRSGNYV